MVNHRYQDEVKTMMGRKHLWTTTILINQGSNFGDVDMTILSEQNGRVVEKKINDINDNSVRYKIIKLLHDKRDSIKDVC